LYIPDNYKLYTIELQLSLPQVMSIFKLFKVLYTSL